MISLCTANFNKWIYLEKFLDSIKRYEIEYISEIVIVDDCSTDDSCEVIEKRINRNKNIKVKLIKNEINKGPGPSYNISVRKTTNDFIMIMDSDDFIIESSLYHKFNYLNENNECQIIYGNGKMYSCKDKIYITSSLNDTFFSTIFSQSLSIIKKYFQTSVSSLYVPWCLIRKSFLIDIIWWFDDRIKSNDRILNIKIFNYINSKKQIWYCSIPCFAYRIWDTNISNRYQYMEDLMLEVVNKYWEINNQKTLLSNIYFTIAMNALKNWDKKISFFYYKKSIKHNFSFKKLITFWMWFFIPYFIINSFIVRKYAQKIYMIVTW